MRLILILLLSFIGYACSGGGFSSNSPAKQKQEEPEEEEEEPQEEDVEEAQVVVEDDDEDDEEEEEEPKNPEKEITFGKDVRFHIGDGQWTPQTNPGCDGQLKTHDLSGTVFIFPFEVLEDGTKVEFKIGFICGITTFIQVNNTVELDGEWDAKVLKNSGNKLPDTKLDKGKYELIFKSGIIPIKNEQDDFVVGDIELTANKKIIPGEPRTE